MGAILGVNKRWYPTVTDRGTYPELEDDYDYGVRSCLCTVLVAGSIGDYAAYQGIGDNPQWIAQHGDKISFEEACCHFPGGQLERERYRR